MKYTTTISGLTTADQFPACPESIESQVEWYLNYTAWFNANWVSRRIAGRAKPATVAKTIAKLGLVRQISAKATSFDTSGKGRHVTHNLI